MTKYSYIALGTVLILIICRIHASLFYHNRPVGPLFHSVFALVYIIPAVYVSVFVYHDILLLIEFGLLRFMLYNPALNEMRRKPFFYLSVNSENPSWWDRIEIKWGKAYPYVWALSLVLYISVLFFI